MTALWYVAYFFGGAFFCNAIPHIVSGTTGRAFQTPFAKPSGRGLSSARVNVLWGACNLAVAYVLVFRVGAFDLRDGWDAIAFGAGSIAIAILSAHLFGPLHGGDFKNSQT